jgi:hypothetical protein
VVRIPYEVGVLDMHLGDHAADTSGFGIPTHVIANQTDQS